MFNRLANITVNWGEPGLESRAVFKHFKDLKFRHLSTTTTVAKLEFFSD